MIKFFVSKGTRFYVASWVQKGDYINESGFSVIILGLGVAWTDRQFNPLRMEWVIPRNAWDDV